jgi:hypothetical protein
MALDPIKFFNACNPSKTLKIEHKEDQQYYIDFSSVRGGNVIQRLRRTIANQPNESTCQLFTGHIGCGKSTELFRLKDELEKQGFHVVYFESSADLDMADVEVNIRLRPSYFINLFNEIADFLQTPVVPEFEFSLPLGIGKVTAKTKDSPRLRSQLRQYLEPRTSGILEAINQQVLERAKEQLQLQGYQGLVVIIDNLPKRLVVLSQNICLLTGVSS